MGQADDSVPGVLSNNKRSHDTTPEEFDHINSINYRGCWLSSRAAIKQMLTQDPLPTHDGRPGVRGSVVNIASQLGVVGRPAARKSHWNNEMSLPP
jgi:NAD(P)-dependent dehydrogenase (short-subunit alcohol dehydrogenase family)